MIMILGLPIRLELALSEMFAGQSSFLAAEYCTSLEFISTLVSFFT